MYVENLAQCLQQAQTKPQFPFLSSFTFVPSTILLAFVRLTKLSSRLSQQQHKRHFRPGGPLLGGRPGHCETLSSIRGLYPPEARDTSCDNQTCF